MTQQANDFDAGFEKPVSNLWKPGKEGNVLKGVLLSVKDTDGKYGPTKIYEFRGIAGKFNNIKEDGKGNDVVAEEETEVKDGDTYAVFERSTFEDDIRKAKMGQQVILRFTEWRTPKSGGKPYKYVECKLGPMDEQYAKEHGGSGADDVNF